MLPKNLTRFNGREHASIYLLATTANLLLSIPEYLAIHSAAVSGIPIDSGTARLVATYGLGLGLALEFFWSLLIFQGFLVLIPLTLVGSSLIERHWRLLYIFAGMFASGFVGYWIGIKFLRTLGWYSSLQNGGVDSSSVYLQLFWFGLFATVCYIAMILVLRRSYNKLVSAKGSIIIPPRTRL